MRKRIMVVDDEIIIAQLLDLQLRHRGYTVMTATDPFTALTLLQTETPDLIVLDLMMPGMDGTELCRKIRAMPETGATPIFIFSARNDAQIVQSSMAAGANAHFSKTDTRDLLAGIKRLLN